MKRSAKLLDGVVAVALLLFLAGAKAQVQVPELTRPVTDLTNTLSVQQASQLEHKIKAFEASHGSQLAVLIIDSTQPEDIAQFGIRVADAWKIGREQEDDGVILIIAKADRRLRIEVGYGLEGAIPDAVAKRIIEDFIKPHFRKGDFYAGIAEGIDRLMALIEGEQLPPPAKAKSVPQDGSLVMVLVIAIVIGNLLAVLAGRPLSALLSAAGAFVAGMFLLALPWLMALFVGLMVFFMVVARSSRTSRWSAGRGNVGHWGGGSSWGGGGGGSFGGGGASGSW